MKDFSKNPLGKQIKDARLLRGKTLKELGKDIGRQPTLISQVENGLADPSMSTLRQIARVLKVIFTVGEDDRT